MYNQAFSKIWIIVIFIILIGGGIFAWQYFGALEEKMPVKELEVSKVASEKEIKAPEELKETRTDVSCQDECSQKGLRRCSNNNDYQICGNYDEDSCLEWGLALPCFPGEVCKNGYCAIPKGTKLLLIVEDVLYKGLSQSLTTYGNDVKRELGFETIIKTFPSSANVSEIRSYIKQVYNNYKLAGVLLIGNLPTGRFFHSGKKYDLLSDRIYQDVYNNCEYLKDHCWPVKGGEECGAFDWLSCGATENFFLSRLTPNSSTQDSLSLLKDYFKRNHQYRTGGFSFSRKFLMYAPFFLDQPLQQRKKSIEIIKRDELGFLNMYDENAIKIIDIEREDSDQLFLNEIKKSYGYEGVFISAHGDPSGHQKNIKSENVINSNAFSINLHSCATGNFLERDYIAGKYLFEGNSLFVSTQVVPGTERLNLASVYYSLINSKPLYKALKSYQNLSEIGVFGDLTLRMRYIKKPLYHKPKDPIIAISQTSLYIAPKTSGTEGFSLNVKNLGKSSLRFGFVYKELVSPRGYKGVFLLE